jgi:Na+-driven multidrug efflux pump
MKIGFLLIIPFWLVVTTLIFSGQKLLFSDNVANCREIAAIYSFWHLAFYPIMAAGAVMAAMMRGWGNTTRPAVYSVICIVLKATLTPILSFEQGFSWLGNFVFLDLGIRGVAIASGITYLLFFALMLLEFRKYSFGWLAKMWALELQWRAVTMVLRSAWFAILVPVTSCLMLMGVLGVMGAQNGALAEAFSLAKRFELYFIQLAVCLGSGTMVVVSSSLAVKDFVRARQAMCTALTVLFLGGIPIVVWMFLHSAWFYQLLTTNKSIIAFGREYFVWGGVSSLFLVGIIVLNFVFQAIGRPERVLPFLTVAIVFVPGVGSWILHVGFIDYIGYLILISTGAAVSFAWALHCLMKADELSPRHEC